MATTAFGASRLTAFRTASARVFSIALFGVLPALLILLVFSWTVRSPQFVSDFHGDLYSAGRAILAGHDPYDPAFLARLAAAARAGGHPSTTFAVPVYPAPGLLLATPLALLPFQSAGIVFSVLSLAALVAGLRLLGVRDWRCYGAALLSWPTIHSLRLGQVNGFLVLGSGLLWRARDRTWIAAAAAAAVILAKLFLWPLGLFLLLTRRWRTAAGTVFVSAVVVMVGWGAIGFHGLSSYPRMLSDLSAVEGRAGVSFVSLAASLGLSTAAGAAAGWLLCALLLGGAFRVLRREAGERRAFGLCIAAGLAASTLVWPHYLVVLYVPVALLAPTLGPLWIVPLLTYLAPVELTHGDVGAIVLYLLLEAIVVLSLCAPLLPRQGRVVRNFRRMPPAWGAAKRLGAPGPAGRLPHGLGSTSFAHISRYSGRRKGQQDPY